MYYLENQIRAGELFDIGIREINERPTALHTHDFVELFWIVSGKGVHHINEVDIPLRSGDLVFVRQHDTHNFSGAPGQPLILTNLAIPAAHFLRLSRQYDEIAALWPSAPTLPSCFRLSHDTTMEMHRRTAILAQARRSKFVLDRFLINLAWHLRSLSATPTARAPKWLSEAVEALNRPEHFREGVQALVRLAGHSHEHVSRSVREHYGQTPSALVLQMRLAYAASELILTDRTIRDIADSCGYSSMAHFYAIFRKHHHASPHRYRQRHGGTRGSRRAGQG